MATSVITGTIKDVSGTALSGVTVLAKLRPLGFASSGAVELAQQITTTTDASGIYTFTLERNADVLPTGTWYEIEEQIPQANGGRRVWAITVGTSNTTVYASLINAPPDAGVTNYLTQATGDARYLSTTTGDLRYPLLSILTAAGDLAVASASGVWTRLAKGSALKYLRVNAGGTALEYADPLVTSVATRTGAITLAVADVSGAAPTASPTFTGTVTAPIVTGTGEHTAADFSVTGLTGATSGGRLVGFTATVAPTTGTFLTGDVVFSRNGHAWVCTSGGSPGTWVDAGSYGSGAGVGNHVVQATNSAAQSINNSTETVVSFDTEDYDTDSFHTLSTGVFTIPAAGDYEISGSIAFAANATGIREAYVTKNSTTGTGSIYSYEIPAMAASDPTMLVIPTFRYTFANADVVRIVVFQSSGGALNVLGNNGAQHGTFIRIVRVN